MYQIHITDAATTDIKEALTYIKDRLQNPVAASNLADEISEQLSLLKEYPYVGHQLRDSFLMETGIRCLLIKNYRAFYIVSEEVDKKTVTIIRFLYARREYESILLQGKDS